MKSSSFVPSLACLLRVTALVASAIPGAASAGIITNISAFSLPGASTGTLGPVGPAATPAPNNDNISTASPNAVPYSIFFNAGGVGHADAEFIVADSGGTTEYRFFTQVFGAPVVNNTGQTWTDFHFRLGFGTGSGFVASSALDLLDFDTPDRDPVPVSSAFTTLSHQSDAIDWTGGTVPSIGTVRFDFAIDVPDSLQSINPSGLNRFTLRMTPTVAPAIPEPATTLLLLAGLGGVLATRRLKVRGSTGGRA